MTFDVVNTVEQHDGTHCIVQSFALLCDVLEVSSSHEIVDRKRGGPGRTPTGNVQYRLLWLGAGAGTTMGGKGTSPVILMPNKTSPCVNDRNTVRLRSNLIEGL